MKKTLTQAIIVSFIALFTTISLYGQVTIGSTEPPVAGALLDLKQSGTTTLGLGLPRVKLTKLTGDLAETLGATSGSYSGDHTGLLVYNIEEKINDVCDASKNAYIGLHVWDGSEWQTLKKGKGRDNHTNYDPITETLTDFEGNTYTTKLMPDGKRWMTQNLRSIINSDNINIGCPEKLRLNPGYWTDNPSSVEIGNAIPNDVSDIVGEYTNNGIVINNQTYTDFAEEFGLLYNFNHAVRACPQGWHLPSEVEWEDLANSLGGSAVAGKKLKANDGVYSSVDGNTKNWDGYPAGDPNNSGFNAVPTGLVHPTDLAHAFSDVSYWWTTTSGIIRYVNSSDEDLKAHGPDSLERYFAVRCVQD